MSNEIELWKPDKPFLSLWDMEAHGFPGPGPDFVRRADFLTEIGELRTKLKEKDYPDKAARDELKARIEARLPAYRREIDKEYRRALYDPTYTLNVEHKGRTYPDIPFMRGGIWGQAAGGPDEHAASDVMLIGKHPGRTELERGLNFCGPSSEDLFRACERCGIDEAEYLSWYATNLVKFDRPGGGTGETARGWVNDCLPILWQEMIINRPRFILCLGGEATKALLGPGHNLLNTAGRMLPFRYKASPLGRQPRTCADLEDHEAVVMCVPHPAYVFRKPEAFDDLYLGIKQFWELTKAEIEASEEERDVHHVSLYTEAALADVVSAIRSRPGDLTIAIDAEWHGKNWNDDDAYLRTVQFSPAGKEAYCVNLAGVGGNPTFSPSPQAAIEQLRRLVADKDDGVVRVGGHAFRADTPWLMAAGLDLRPFFEVPDDADPSVMPRGFDTLYLAHAAHESLESFKLENLAMKYTSCPRWDVKLQAWKKKYCKENKVKDKDLEGYGMCPPEVLIPYGNYDADSTRRLVDVFWAHCTEDSFRVDPKTGRGLDSRPAYLNSMKAWLGFLEMELTGVEVDMGRVEALTKLYSEKAAQLRRHMQERLNWPDFNPRSGPQCRELLFGRRLNGTIDKSTGEPKVVRPEGAIEPLYLTPIKTTEKPPKQWERVVRDGDEHRFTAATDKETLGILAQDNDIVGLLRDVRYLSHVSSSLLRPPKPPAAPKAGGRAEAARLDRLLLLPGVSGELREAGAAAFGRVEPIPEPESPDDDGFGEDAVYDGGFVGYTDRDGRVRSHFYAAETGRCTSSRPNLQNLAKQRDADYQRILGYFDEKKGKEVAPYRDVFGGLAYRDPIRTIMRASPGCVLLEFDLKSAEIAMLAWQADDRQMIEDVNRVMLDEEHPDYLDIHAATACTAFKLDCPPTKAGLKALGKLHLRTPAKNVRFGVPYGRSAEAIARQCREQGNPIAVAEAAGLIEGWHARYPQGSEFLARCRARPHNPGWMAGPFGRLRRFPETTDEKVRADQERQAQNYTIQNGVADAISLAIYNMIRYRDANRSEGDFRLVLQIHDALIMEVPIAHVPWVHDVVLPRCVVEGVPITPLDLDGGDTILKGRPPYNFGIDVELFLNWGDKLAYGPDRDAVIRAGLDPKYLPEEEKPATPKAG